METDETQIDIMTTIHNKIQKILTNDYIRTSRVLSGNGVKCIKLSNMLAVSSAFATGLSSILAFSSGFFQNSYVSYVAGCSGVIAMVLMKFSYYAGSQGHYHDAKLKNHLTREYKFIADFIRDPRSLKPINEPSIPDIMGVGGLDNSSRLFSPMRHSPLRIEPTSPQALQYSKIGTIPQQKKEDKQLNDVQFDQTIWVM